MNLIDVLTEEINKYLRKFMKAQWKETDKKPCKARKQTQNEKQKLREIHKCKI